MIPTPRYDIMSIPVTYKEVHFFRSMLEGQWAVVFDELGIPWEYEPKGYELEGVGWYVPDFWLPDHKTFIEVKGPVPTPHELAKLESLWNSYGQNVDCALLGQIPASATELPFPGGDATTHFFPASAYFANRNLLLMLANDSPARLTAAYAAARSFQFKPTSLHPAIKQIDLLYKQAIELAKQAIECHKQAIELEKRGWTLRKQSIAFFHKSEKLGKQLFPLRNQAWELKKKMRVIHTPLSETEEQKNMLHKQYIECRSSLTRHYENLLELRASTWNLLHKNQTKGIGK